MHDRHAGIPFELPPVHIEAEDAEDESVTHAVASKITPVCLHVGTLNMHMVLPGAWFRTILPTLDVLCLQEVTLQCLQEVVAICQQEGFCVVSPVERGMVPAEGFGACIVMKESKLQCLRVKVSPLPHPSPRAFLQAHALIHENGALVLVATGHLTAGSDKTEERSIELQSILRKLEATKGMDACIFAGDVNMRCDEVNLVPGHSY